jgi:hypothetical protein
MSALEYHSTPRLDLRVLVLIGVGAVAGLVLWSASLASDIRRCFLRRM